PNALESPLACLNTTSNEPCDVLTRYKSPTFAGATARQAWACPILARSRSGIIVRRHFMRGSEVHLGDRAQCVWSIHFHKFLGAFFHARRHTAFQPHTHFLPFTLQPINEGFSRKDRCGRHCDICFRSWPLF